MSRQLSWSETFALGHAALDREHGALLDAINRISAMAAGSGAADAMAEALRELRASAIGHFRHEDRILRTIADNATLYKDKAPFLEALSDAAIEDHIDEHEHALARLGQIMEQAPSLPGLELQDTLTHWFVNHAIKRDARVKTLLQAIAADCEDLLAKLV